MWKLGNIEINGPIVLAPMAGVTNLAYRRMCRNFGAGMTTTEMLSDKGIFYDGKKTKELAAIDKNEHPCAIQIFGGELDTMINAAKWVDNETDADIIDINMGCPVPKVLKSDAGSKYMLDVNRIYNTVKAIVDNVYQNTNDYAHNTFILPSIRKSPLPYCPYVHLCLCNT